MFTCYSNYCQPLQLKCRRPMLLTKQQRVDSFGSMIQLCLISIEYKFLQVLFQFSSCLQLFYVFRTFICHLLEAFGELLEYGYERRKRTVKDSQFPSLSLAGGVPSSPTTTVHRCIRAAAKASSRLSLSCFLTYFQVI